MSAFYRELAPGRFASGGLTRGPWSAEAQHGGPPCALLGTHMAALAPEGFRATRLTFEMLRPVGLVPLAVEASVVRAGQSAAWIDGALRAEGARGEVEVMRARGVFVRAREGSAVEVAGAGVSGPEGAKPFDAASWRLSWDEGYHTAIELRFGRAEPPTRVAWIRARVPLVEDRAWTPLGRALVAVDSIGGVCAVLSFADWSFINAETSCHLVREPEGEWVALAGTQSVAPDGVGLGGAVLHDARGPIGHGLQSQVVARRR